MSVPRKTSLRKRNGSGLVIPSSSSAPSGLAMPIISWRSPLKKRKDSGHDPSSSPTPSPLARAISWRGLVGRSKDSGHEIPSSSPVNGVGKQHVVHNSDSVTPTSPINPQDSGVEPTNTSPTCSSTESSPVRGVGTKRLLFAAELKRKQKSDIGTFDPGYGTATEQNDVPSTATNLPILPAHQDSGLEDVDSSPTLPTKNFNVAHSTQGIEARYSAEPKRKRARKIDYKESDADESENESDVSVDSPTLNTHSGRPIAKKRYTGRGKSPELGSPILKTRSGRPAPKKRYRGSEKSPEIEVDVLTIPPTRNTRTGRPITKRRSQRLEKSSEERQTSPEIDTPTLNTRSERPVPKKRYEGRKSSPERPIDVSPVPQISEDRTEPPAPKKCHQRREKSPEVHIDVTTVSSPPRTRSTRAHVQAARIQYQERQKSPESKSVVTKTNPIEDIFHETQKPTDIGAKIVFIKGTVYPLRRYPTDPFRVYLHVETPLPITALFWNQERKDMFFKENEYQRNEMRRKMAIQHPKYYYLPGDERLWYHERIWCDGCVKWVLSKRSPEAPDFADRDRVLALYG